MFYQKKKKYFIIIIFALLILLHYLGALKPLEAIISQTFDYGEKYVYKIGNKIKNVANKKRKISELKKENYQLSQAINKLIIENSKLKKVQRENILLRKQLKFYQKRNYKYKLANIIAKNLINENLNYFVIDRGEEDGVKNGCPVLAEDGIVIGKVAKVEKKLSKVFLLSSDYCKLAATIQGNNNTSGLIEGELGLSIKMNYIPQDAKISQDQIVVTSGLEKYIPAGLVIGKISKVEANPSELFKQAIVKPLVDFNKLTIVSVIIP